jgi:endonuclease V-like protein UPF0215 family
MKNQVRVLGIDDSPFKFKDRKALVVGALVRVPNYLEGVMRTEVEVDGIDSTERLIHMISESRYRDQIKAVMIDGIAVAGFNVLDIESLHESLGIPVLTVTRDEPDFNTIRAALKKHFEDWERRYELISKLKLRQIRTEHKPLYVSGLGADREELERLVTISTVRGAVPEPIRMAHLIATAMVRGESYGRP